MQAPKTIFGRQLRRFAHQADVLRLELLQQWGGVYMDMDILVLSPLDELHRHGLHLLWLYLLWLCVLWRAARHGRWTSPCYLVTTFRARGFNPMCQRLQPYVPEAATFRARGCNPMCPRYELSMAHEGVEGTIGLGNALMLARPNASLLRVWYQRYHGFSDAVWNGFSLRLPFELAQQMPDSVHTVDYAKFYWPPWNPWGIAQLYRTQTCILPEQQAVHLWETKVWASLLGKLTPEMVRERSTCFTRLAAAIMDDSYDFGAARLAPNVLAHRNDPLLFSSSLLSRLLNPAPPPAPAAAAAALPRASAGCADDAGAACHGWAAKGECIRNAGFMSTSCRLTCGKCVKR